MNATAYADQLAAATRDAHRVAAAAGTEPGATYTRGIATPSLLSLAADINAIINGSVPGRCPHLGRSPAVAYAAAWAPGQVVCAQCLPELTPDEGEAVTCDRCRRRNGLLSSCAVAIGPVLVMFGLCLPCQGKTTDRKGN